MSFDLRNRLTIYNTKQRCLTCNEYNFITTKLMNDEFYVLFYILLLMHSLQRFVYL